MTKALQCESIALADVRLLFDGVIEKLPYIDASKIYLAENATNIKYAEVETRFIKIPSGRERTLTEGESIACRSLVKNDYANTIETHDEENMVDEVLAKKSKKQKSGYMNCKFVLRSSNLVQRLFGLSENALNELRQSLTSENLEEQLFLEVNRRFWSP